MITVSCRKRDLKGENVPKFETFCQQDSSDMEYLPNGMYNRRFIRDTSPDLNNLSLLARWLYENMDGSFHGSIHGPQNMTTTCHYSKTQADMCREEALKGRCNGQTFVGSSGIEKAKKLAEGLIKCYGMESKPYNIKYQLPIIEPNESDNEYWENVASEIKSLGVNKVSIFRYGSTQETKTVEFNIK